MYSKSNVQWKNTHVLDTQYSILNTQYSILSKNYFPFGMEMPNFGYKAEEYRYGFNGMEKDNEMKGKGKKFMDLF